MWIRPNNQRKEADAAKALLSVPGGDHLTLLNVYNSYRESKLNFSPICSRFRFTTFTTDQHDKNWTWQNYLSARALGQADNVRTQLLRTMERFEIDLVSTQDQRTFYTNIQKALVCGFFMQVAHKEGEKGNYTTVKDNQVQIYLPFTPVDVYLYIAQVVGLHPSCGLDTQPEWVLFNEFVLTTRPFIRTVTEVRPEWYVSSSFAFLSSPS